MCSLVSASHLFLVDSAQAGVSLRRVATEGLRLGERSGAESTLDAESRLLLLDFVGGLFSLKPWLWGRAFVAGAGLGEDRGELLFRKSALS